MRSQWCRSLGESVTLLMAVDHEKGGKNNTAAASLQMKCCFRAFPLQIRCDSETLSGLNPPFFLYIAGEADYGGGGDKEVCPRRQQPHHCTVQ